MSESNELEIRLQYYASAWGLEFEAERIKTFSSVLVPATQGVTKAILKLLLPGSDEQSSAAWLKYHAGHGAVKLLAADAEALLLERIQPGTPLTDQVKAGQDEEATKIFCEVVRQLHAHPLTEPTDFTTLAQRGRAFQRVNIDVFPPGLVNQAVKLFQELVSSQPSLYLLHGDLHHDNILYDTDRGWLVIDPKGIVGELAYETSTFLRNPIDSFQLYARPDTIRRRVHSIGTELKLDETRIMQWCFVHAVLSTLWLIEDNCPVQLIDEGRQFAQICLGLI